MTGCRIADKLRRPLLEPGTYLATCVDWRTSLYRSVQPKIELVFEIEEPGMPDRVRLSRFYNCDSFHGGPSSKRDFAVSAGSNYAREFGRLLPHFDPTDVSPNHLIGATFEVTVETVTLDGHGREIPRALWYSKIAAVESMLPVPGAPPSRQGEG